MAEARGLDADRVRRPHLLRAGRDPAAPDRQDRPDRLLGRGPVRSSGSAAILFVGGMAMGASRLMLVLNDKLDPIDALDTTPRPRRRHRRSRRSAGSPSSPPSSGWARRGGSGSATRSEPSWSPAAGSPSAATRSTRRWSSAGSGFALMVPTWLALRGADRRRARPRAPGARRRGAVPHADTSR